MMRNAHLDQLKKKQEQVEIRKTAEEEKDVQREVLIQVIKDKKILEEDKKEARAMEEFDEERGNKVFR